MKSYGTELSVFVSGLIVLTLLAFASAAHAQDGRGQGFGGAGGNIVSERMAKRLDLDDTQQQTVDNIIAAAKPEIDALREQTKANRAALAALDTTADDYSVALERAAAERGRLATETTLLLSRVRSEVSAVLTEEQRAKLDRGDRRGSKRGNRGGRDRDGRRGDRSKADSSEDTAS